jgi:hypothetical protein
MAAALSRIAVVAVAVGLLAATALVADHGAARAAVGQPTGPLIATDRPDAAVLVAQGMKPGESRAGEVTVTNVGDTAGAFALGATGLSESSPRLSDVLNLIVQDVTPGRPASQLYNGPIQGVSGVALGTLQQGEARRYRFTVNVFSGAGNAYQGATATTSFVWSASGSAAPPPASPPAPPAPKPKSLVKPAVAPRATLVAAARQSGKSGSVGAWVTCETRCGALLTGSATDGSKKLTLRAVRRNLSGPVRVRMSMRLPAKARAAIADGRAVAVRLRLKATMGTYVVVARRTVRVGGTHR